MVLQCNERVGRMVSMFAWFIASWAVAEGGLRFFVKAHPKVNRLDPVVGWKPRPLMRFRHGDDDAAVTVSFNRAGYRDQDHPKDKPVGTLRIAFLGNSVVESREVDLANTYWKRLESMVSARLARPVEVLNFGVNGYSTAQSLLTLERTALDYKPDLVVLVFFNGTDITSNLYALGRHKMRPYYQVVDGVLAPRSTPGQDPKFRMQMMRESFRSALYDYSRVMQVIRDTRVRLRFWLKKAKAKAKNAENYDVNHEALLAPQSADFAEAWDVSAALTGGVAQTAKAAGARFLLVVYPSSVQVDGTGMDYPETRLAAHARANGFACTTLLQAFQRASADGTRLFVDQVHLNAVGHNIAAHALEDAVASALA